MELAHSKHVRFDPTFEAEDEERTLRRLARQEEKKVGDKCGCANVVYESFESDAASRYLLLRRVAD